MESLNLRLEENSGSLADITGWEIEAEVQSPKAKAPLDLVNGWCFLEIVPMVTMVADEFWS